MSNPTNKKAWEDKLFGPNRLLCCKVCQCENGKKIWCACHRKQIGDVIQSERQKEREKVLEGLDKLLHKDKHFCFGKEPGYGANQLLFSLKEKLKEESNG